MEVRHSPWKSKKASSGNEGLHGDVEPGTDTDQKRLCYPGSRGSDAFVLGGFPIKIGYGGTCVFVLSSVSFSGGLYLWFRSSELPASPDHEAARETGPFNMTSYHHRQLYGEKHLGPQGKNPVLPRSTHTGRLLPTVLPQMPGADTVVVHVGSNNIRRASSEHLF